MKVIVDRLTLNAALKVLWNTRKHDDLHGALAQQAGLAQPHIWYFIIDGNRSDYMGPDVELFATEQAAQARLIEWANDFMAEGGDDVEPVETFAEAQAYVEEMVIGTNIYIDSRMLQG